MMLNMMFTTLKYNISRGKREGGREGMVQEAEEERRRGRSIVDEKEKNRNTKIF